MSDSDREGSVQSSQVLSVHPDSFRRVDQTVRSRIPNVGIGTEVLNAIRRDVEAAVAPIRRLAAMAEGVRRGLARQRSEEASALEPIGLRPVGIRSGAWLSLLVVRLRLTRSGITAKQLGEVAASRWAEVLRLIVAALLEKLDQRAAEGVEAAASLLEAVDRDNALPFNPLTERAPPDDPVRILPLPHAPPSVLGRLHLSEAAPVRAA